MLSDETTHQLEELYKHQSAYRPNAAITRQLHEKVMVMVVGATCEGKNAIIESALGFDERFAKVGRLTSRPPRDEDDPEAYTYYTHDDSGLPPLLERISSRDVVQYAINLHTKFIYGSALGDYPGRYNLGDVVSNAVESFRHLGFQHALAVTVISQPHTWAQRFEKRFPLGHPQREARRNEAIESFEWSLNQADSDHVWIENKDGRPELGGHELISIVLGESKGNPQCRKLAQASIEAARNISV